ncbi:MAG TPA: hypothetical protein VHU82_08815 [Vicinamibacterales bacterium]|nr:hypothetical protein [Vicinamibacterales bacterium]
MTLRRVCWGLVVMTAAAAVLRGATLPDRRQVISTGRAPGDPAYSSFFGRAVTDAGTFWYTEYHTLRTAKGRTDINTRYVAASGAPIAELSADVGSRRYLPTTRMIDHRDNYRYAIEPQIDRHGVLITQQLAHGAEEHRTLALRDDLMTFQGIMLYIIDQRAALERGQSLYAQSIVPSRMTSYGVRIYKRAVQGNLLTVRLEMSSAAFRFFSTPSDVTIDLASGRLLEFAGPSNLLDDKDKPVRVHIIYEYP